MKFKNNVFYSRFLNKSIENLIAEFAQTQSHGQNIQTLTKLINLFFSSMKSNFSSIGYYTVQDPITLPAASNPIYVLIDQWLEFECTYYNKVDSLNESTIQLFKKFAADLFSYLQ